MLVFYDPNAVLEQDRVVDGQSRWQAIAFAEDGLMLVVSHVAADVADEDEGQVIRIVSARRVTRRERRRYEQANGSI